jgi:GNAT superfamily N-acetyltransferase
MRSYLSTDERREYLTRVAELGALAQDIERARTTAGRATSGFGLDPRRHHESPHAVMYGEHVRLADGGEIVVRPIEHGDAHDLAVGMRQLSALSRFRRFRTPIDHLSPAQLRELTEIDHESHEAIVAFDAASGEGIGVARYLRAPDDPAQAEFTCAVLDRWQRRGVGTALIERLAARARAVGIERFTALTVVGNEPARRLAVRVADVVSERRMGGAVEISGRPREAMS